MSYRDIAGGGGTVIKNQFHIVEAKKSFPLFPVVSCFNTFLIFMISSLQRKIKNCNGHPCPSVTMHDAETT